MLSKRTSIYFIVYNVNAGVLEKLQSVIINVV